MRDNTGENIPDGYESGSMNRSLKVSQAFSRARDSYDQYALVQDFVAQRLAATILTKEGPTLGTLLEVGCGTGMLSRRLASHADQYVLTDISFSLLQKAQEQAKGRTFSLLWSMANILVSQRLLM